MCRKSSVFRVGLLVLIVLGIVAGCTSEVGELNNDEQIMDNQVLTEVGFMEIEEDEIAIYQAHASVAAANQMGFEMIRAMSKNEEGNLLLSPTSLAFALAMLQNGAQGDTLSEIIGVLGDEEEGINERYNILMNYFNSLDEDNPEKYPGIKLLIGNSLWLRDNLEPEQSFVNTLSEKYNAEVFTEDFADPKTIDYMNLWVEEQTNHLLKDTINEIEPDVIAYLMNTVYFKGTWAEEFTEHETVSEDFYNGNGETSLVDMMHKSEALAYYEDDLCQITNLPYYGGSSMVVVLPKGDIDEFISTIDYDTLSGNIKKLGEEHEALELSIPKFDYQTENNLKDLLKESGMEKVFSPVEAELGRFVNVEGENAYVSQIFQNARIILDEKGTEAAVVTVIEAKTTSMEMPPENLIVFECNKPFMYLIRDDATDAILFIGVVQGL